MKVSLLGQLTFLTLFLCYYPKEALLFHLYSSWPLISCFWHSVCLYAFKRSLYSYTFKCCLCFIHIQMVSLFYKLSNDVYILYTFKGYNTLRIYLLLVCCRHYNFLESLLLFPIEIVLNVEGDRELFIISFICSRHSFVFMN